MGAEMAKLKTELTEANEKIENLESAIGRIPEAVEGMLNGLKQLSIDTINNLVNVGDVLPSGDDDVAVEKGDEDGDGDDIRPIVTSRRNGKATSK
jgi:CRISPR/Cas system-associated endonuclease Cas3-HD